MLKLSQDDKERALEVISNHGWLTLINIFEQLVKAKGEAVLTLDEEERFLKAKSRYDGAKELLADIKRLKEIISSKKS